jgi:hypothetical protein
MAVDSRMSTPMEVQPISIVRLELVVPCQIAAFDLIGEFICGDRPQIGKVLFTCKTCINPSLTILMGCTSVRTWESTQGSSA